jgi:hypothetical protein
VEQQFLSPQTLAAQALGEVDPAQWSAKSCPCMRVISAQSRLSIQPWPCASRDRAPGAIAASTAVTHLAHIVIPAFR